MELPKPKYTGTVSLEDAIIQRRSIRRFSDEIVSIEDLSQILWAAQGLTKGRQRTAPSAGGLYPIELFVATHDGVFRYVPDGHRIEEIIKKEVRAKLSAAALNQGFIKDAPVVLVITAVFERVTSKYGERGERYVHQESGHVAQNVCLACAALGLGTLVVGAFHDLEVQKVLGISERFEPLYIMPIGRKG
ncbi:SagB/ThcOx family dehydrogenase [archaeon]|nr:SagB/ThcOx family dehydrogenase [archaeon]